MVLRMQSVGQKHCFAEAGCEPQNLSTLLPLAPSLTPFVSGFSGGRVKQHPIANPNRHGGEAFGVRTTWGWVQ